MSIKMLAMVIVAMAAIIYTDRLGGPSLTDGTLTIWLRGML